ncbi:hypothetical protein Anas_02456 [Armadillidium nasatum]|uniref:Tyrosine-protein phosphatase domain-containing protein n=1 Tax=Armadillidium nasatum TaxID=96803 RepID=A0A5N5TE21_9CRUS|nr:hypothetical protein Anas_02456 [Armadillidium nasatum]
MDKEIRYKYNRFKNILPADSKRVSLLSVHGRPRDLYINSIMVDGFSKKDTYPPIVPTVDVPLEFGELNVSLLSSTSHEYFIENWVKIEGNFQGSQTLAFECRVIQLLGWSSSSIVPETGPEQLFSMLDYIYSGGPYNCPLLFTCADGVTACGAALALDITRQRSEALGEVNIFSSCIRIINCRPEFIVSLEQYRLLHDYLASYIFAL